MNPEAKGKSTVGPVPTSFDWAPPTGNQLADVPGVAGIAAALLVATYH